MTVPHSRDLSPLAPGGGALTPAGRRLPASMIGRPACDDRSMLARAGRSSDTGAGTARWMGAIADASAAIALKDDKAFWAMHA